MSNGNLLPYTCGKFAPHDAAAPPVPAAVFCGGGAAPGLTRAPLRRYDLAIASTLRVSQDACAGEKMKAAEFLPPC